MRTGDSDYRRSERALQAAEPEQHHGSAYGITPHGSRFMEANGEWVGYIKQPGGWRME